MLELKMQQNLSLVLIILVQYLCFNMILVASCWATPCHGRALQKTPLTKGFLPFHGFR